MPSTLSRCRPPEPKSLCSVLVVSVPRSKPPGADGGLSLELQPPAGMPTCRAVSTLPVTVQLATRFTVKP
jgi:hypothetical protein